MSEKWLKAEILAKKLVISVLLAGGAILLFLFIPKVLVFMILQPASRYAE